MISKATIALIIMLAFTATAYAQAGTSAPAPTAPTGEGDLLSIPPGNIFYDLKIFVQDAQEAITTDPTRKALLKQKHLNERMKELQNDALNNGLKNANTILKKITIKQMELDEALEELKPKCADVSTGDITPCKEFQNESNKKKIYEGIKRQNVNVLTRLIESDKMPEQSKQGLRNAITKSGLKTTERTESEVPEGTDIVTANMTQSYRSTAISSIPFKTAMVYVKGTNKKYSIVLNADSATISDEVTLLDPEYSIYPTESQMNEIMSIANNINEKKRMSWQDAIKLTGLWMDIPKKSGS